MRLIIQIGENKWEYTNDNATMQLRQTPFNRTLYIEAEGLHMHLTMSDDDLMMVDKVIETREDS